MADRPLLLIPDPATVVRHNKGGGPSKVNFPPGTRQVSRIEPRIAELEQALAARRVELTQSPVGIDPEQVLVLETVGGVDDFYKALKSIDGLEWLGDIDADVIAQEDEDFYEDSPTGGQDLSGRVYLIMANQRGLQQLRAFWEVFRQNPDAAQFQHGYTKWRDLFKQLKDIRPWGPVDRLFETGLDRDWQQRVALGEEEVRVEVELWFRVDPAVRARSVQAVEHYLEAVAGTLLAQSTIPEIAYHAVLVRLPIRAVQDILSLQETSLVYCDQVMFLRPVGQAVVGVPQGEDSPEDTLPREEVNLPEGSPVVAVLDGMPLENHALLANRLVVDDPDEWASEYEPSERIHGTAMVSLAVYGDLDDAEPPLSRPIYVRPIMKPNPYDWNRPRREWVPEEALPVDLVHRAVRRMFEGDGHIGPVAPDVRVINLSVCDSSRMFDRYLSPWARLIDYLAWRYRVLFVVSAGNYAEDVELDISHGNWRTLRDDSHRLEASLLKAVTSAARNRRLYSPAESINALTVGAVHSDGSTPSALPPAMVDPFSSAFLPSPINAQGLGFRRAVKPDVLFPGGRQTYKEKLTARGPNIVLEATWLKRAPGQRAATPGTPGDLSATSYSRGTSNGAALATHTAGRLYDVLSSLRQEPSGRGIDPRYLSVVMKALMVHGASWGEAEARIRQHIPEISEDGLTRLLGYGQVNSTRLFECTSERVTLIGYGSLGDAEAHRFEVPLPPSLSGQTVWRRLTVTLAWLTPVNPSHRGYRLGDLWFTPYGEHKDDASVKELLRVTRQEADWQTARRGTTQHEIFDGSSATSFVDGQTLKLQVNCRADAGRLVDMIPYGLVASLEVAPGVNIPIYEEVEARVQARVRARARIQLGTQDA